MAETFKEDPSAAKAFTFTEDAGAAGAFGPGPKTKHPDPKSFSAPDADIPGLESGAIKTNLHKAGPVTAAIPQLFEALSPEEKANFDRMVTDFVKLKGGNPFPGPSFLDNALNREVAGQVVGSAIVPVGEGIGAPIGRAIVGKAPGLASKAMPHTVEAIKKAVEHSTKEHGKVYVAAQVGKDLGRAVSAAGSGVGKTVRAGATPAAAQVGGEVARDMPPASDPAPFRGVMHNAIDRLRASAEGNPRAAELLSRIDAMQTPAVPLPPAGTVTQSTGVH